MSQFDNSFIQPQTPKGALTQTFVILNAVKNLFRRCLLGISMTIAQSEAPLGVWGKELTSTENKSYILNQKS